MKYLNFEGLQYFYSKLSSSLASQYVSQGNLKTINGQSLIGTGDITIEGGTSGDYLPLSGGEMTGYISWENNKSVIDDCELHFNSSLSTSEDRTRLAMESDYLSISYITANDDYTGHIIASVTKNDGPSISVSNDQTDAAIIINNTGIKYKNGGSPTEVFATDGSIADLSTVGDGKYLPLNEGGVIRGTSLEDVEHAIYINVLDTDTVARLHLNKAGVVAKKENEDIIYNASENGAFILWFGAASTPTNASSAAVTNVDFGVNSEGCYIKGKKLEVPEALTQEEIEAICV